MDQYTNKLIPFSGKPIQNPEPLALTDYIQAFLDDTHLGSATEQFYKNRILSFFFYLNRYKVTTFNYEVYKDYFDSLKIGIREKRSAEEKPIQAFFAWLEDKGIYPNITVRPLRSYIPEYLSQCDVRERTKEQYEEGLNRFFSWLESENIQKPKKSDLIRYKNEIAQDHTASTSMTFLSPIRSFFSWLSEKRVYENIAYGMKTRKPAGHTRDYLSPEQARRIMGNVKGDSIIDKRNRALFMLMLGCGLRAFEAADAKIEDLRYRDRVMVLYVRSKGKEEKTDYVRVEPEVYELIEDYLKMRPDVKGEDYLFVSNSNRNSVNGSEHGKLKRDTVSKIIKQMMRDAGIDSSRLTCHSLRHTHATWALHEGEDIMNIKNSLRHANVSVTMVYTHSEENINNTCGTSVLKHLHE